MYRIRQFLGFDMKEEYFKNQKDTHKRKWNTFSNIYIKKTN